jgi:VanZ family protein
MAAARGGLGSARLLRILAAVAICVQLVGLYQPTTPPQPAWFPNADKLEHAVIFGLPVALIMLARRRFSRLVVAIFALHAVVSELIQHFFYTHRSGDPFDVLADVIGVGLGTAVFAVIRARAGSRDAALRVGRP